MTLLDMRQLNTLKTGSYLAAEIPASSAQLRAFIVVGAYAIDEAGRRKTVFKFLNTINQELRFWIDKYGVDKRYIDSWDTDLFVLDRQYKDKIASVEELESEIAPTLIIFRS